MVETREHEGNGNGGSSMKRVHYLFRMELTDIRKKIKEIQDKNLLRHEKILSDEKITKFMVKHNAWPLIKKEIILRGVYGNDWENFK